MKTETVFEEGDIVAHSRYSWVAVRDYRGRWDHTNVATPPGEYNEYAGITFSDANIKEFLEREGPDKWIYVGNRIEAGGKGWRTQ